MSKLFVGILLLSVSLAVGAADVTEIKRYNLLTFRQIDVENPWLQSGNAAGLSQMPELFPSEVRLGFGSSAGNFHSVFTGKTNRSYELSSQSFKKNNRTFLYGSFNYNRSFEKELNYSNTNSPATNYPYLLADTLGNDTYDREFFKLKGVIASPVGEKFYWGLDFDYRVGVASQNRDPRTENKVVRSNILPGLLYKQDRFKLGVNLIYGYYNEDIDVSVVEKGVDQTLFQLHGPGVFVYHSSDSFFRLYQQQRFGGGVQFEYKKSPISNVFYSKYAYSFQTIDDGRGDNATWSAIKNDAKMDEINWEVTDVFSIEHRQKLHQVTTMFCITNKRGTEFIQRLEKVGESDLEHWITYGEEQKYYSLKTNAGLNYLLMSRNENKLMKSLFQVGLGYSGFSERYYLPNKEVQYSNLTLESSFLKLFAFSRSDISAEIKLKYKHHLDGMQNLDATNFIVRKIFLPEFNYLTQNFFSPGFSVCYQIPVKKTLGKYFVKSDFDWYRSAKGLNYTIFSFSTGLMF